MIYPKYYEMLKKQEFFLSKKNKINNDFYNGVYDRYENPRFVEDVVRDVYLGLKAQGFDWFSVEAETEESIHNHNAYAYTEFGNLNNQV